MLTPTQKKKLMDVKKKSYSIEFLLRRYLWVVVTLWLVSLVTLVNHNITSDFLLSLSHCFFLYICDIVLMWLTNVTNYNVI